MRHDRAGKQKGYNAKHRERLRCRVEKLRGKLEALRIVSNPMIMETVLLRASSLLSRYAERVVKLRNVYQYTRSSEATVASPPPIDATQAARTVVLPPNLRAPPSTIIVPGGSLPVTMPSVPPPSLAPWILLKILDMKAAEKAAQTAAETIIDFASVARNE